MNFIIYLFTILMEISCSLLKTDLNFDKHLVAIKGVDLKIVTRENLEFCKDLDQISKGMLLKSALNNKDLLVRLLAECEFTIESLKDVFSVFGSSKYEYNLAFVIIDHYDACNQDWAVTTPKVIDYLIFKCNKDCKILQKIARMNLDDSLNTSEALLKLAKLDTERFVLLINLYGRTNERDLGKAMKYMVDTHLDSKTYEFFFTRERLEFTFDECSEMKEGSDTMFSLAVAIEQRFGSAIHNEILTWLVERRNFDLAVEKVLRIRNEEFLKQFLLKYRETLKRHPKSFQLALVHTVKDQHLSHELLGKCDFDPRILEPIVDQHSHYLFSNCQLTLYRVLKFKKFLVPDYKVVQLLKIPMDKGIFFTVFEIQAKKLLMIKYLGGSRYEHADLYYKQVFQEIFSMFGPREEETKVFSVSLKYHSSIYYQIGRFFGKAFLDRQKFPFELSPRIFKSLLYNTSGTDATNPTDIQLGLQLAVNHESFYYVDIDQSNRKEQRTRLRQNYNELNRGFHEFVSKAEIGMDLMLLQMAFYGSF